MSKITEISQQQKYKNRYSIFIDEKFFLGVDEDVIIKHNLSKGMEVDDDFINNIIKAEEQAKANNCAINLLSFRNRSIKEIETKLKQKGYEENIINNTIEFLQKYGYLNDYEFGKLYIKDKQNIKKAGKNLLKQELFQKGVEKEIIEQLIEENVDMDEEYQRALELAKKKVRTFNSSEDKNSKYRKLSGLLARKGYSFDIISKIIKELL